MTTPVTIEITYNFFPQRLTHDSLFILYTVQVTGQMSQKLNCLILGITSCGLILLKGIRPETVVNIPSELQISER